ncbi:MAG: DNA metabolism protein [Cellulosilyticum sp.]|nr:DNA metabolism protein [Cellulosilyticum sp.]
MLDYLYDGSFSGYLTTLFYAYPLKEEVHIYREQTYSPSLLTISKWIPTEEDKADRVYQSILTKLSYNTLDNLYRLYLSEEEDAETLGLHYIRLCYHFDDQINLAKNNDIIRNVDLTCKRVWTEVHRFYGFVRFKEIGPLTFYAAIEPDHNILPLMMGHFKKRFSDQNFIIHDQKRNCAMIYDQKEIYIRYLTDDESHILSRAETPDAFEELFRTYYKATTIAARKNPRLQNNWMPKRYYKHLIELD